MQLSWLLHFTWNCPEWGSCRCAVVEKVVDLQSRPGRWEGASEDEGGAGSPVRVLGWGWGCVAKSTEPCRGVQRPFLAPSRAPYSG